MTHLPLALESGRPAPIPTDERGPVRFGLLLLLVSFGSLFIWSSLAPLAKGVVAPGSVVVDSNRKAIQHLEGGIVSEILVRDGDVVAAGQVLLRLDEVTSQAQRDVLYGQYLTALAQEARLTAERDQLAAISFPTELTTRDPAGRKASIRSSEERVFAARRDALAGQLSIYEQRIRQLEEQIQGLRAQAKANDEQVRLIVDEIQGLSQLYEKGYASKTRLLELERRRADLTGQRGSLDSEMAKAAVAIGEARLQIIQLRKSFEEEVVAQLQEVQAQSFDLQDRLTSATDVLTRREVRAPSDGIIVSSRVHTVGGVVPAGQTVMEIVPLNDKLIVEAMVAPLDIDVMAVGLEAEVKFSGLSSRKVPILIGQVMHVSADVTTDERGNRYYIAKVEVPPEQLNTVKDIKLIPGMPAEVLIKAGEETLLEYLTKPLTDSFFRAFREV